MRTLFVLVVAAAAGQPAPTGSVRTQAGTASIETLPARGGGAEIRAPEGFIRAEGPAQASSAAGTFGVYPAGTYGRAGPPPRGLETAAAGEALTTPSPDGVAPRTPPDGCRRERSRYVRRLLRATGVDIEDPLALLDGLAGPAGYANALVFSAYGLLPGVDPIRPLAWDFELQGLARELAACAAAARAC